MRNYNDTRSQSKKESCGKKAVELSGEQLAAIAVAIGAK